MDRLLKEDELLVQLPFGRVTLWRKSRSGDFPPPVAVFSRRNVWRESDVAAWIENLPVKYNRPEGNK